MRLIVTIRPGRLTGIREARFADVEHRTHEWRAKAEAIEACNLVSMWKRISIVVGMLLLGLAAGWFLRSSRLNDDYNDLARQHRPASVPRDAVWVGGADGGAYVRCYLDKAADADTCSIWNDYTGALTESGAYRLRDQHRAATEQELNQISFPDFGGHIYLEDGLVLDRQR